MIERFRSLALEPDHLRGMTQTTGRRPLPRIGRDASGAPRPADELAPINQQDVPARRAARFYSHRTLNSFTGLQELGPVHTASVAPGFPGTRTLSHNFTFTYPWCLLRVRMLMPENQTQDEPVWALLL